MLLCTLGASLLGNMLAGKWIARTGYGNKKEKGPDMEKNGIFNSTLSFNKLWNIEVLLNGT